MGAPIGNTNGKQFQKGNTEAAIKAGYSKKVAKEIAYENLTKPHIKEYIGKRKKERENRTEITRDRV